RLRAQGPLLVEIDMNRPVRAEGLAALVLVLAGCGGATSASGADGGGDSGSVADALPDLGSGWTQCASPDGTAVCGGPNACPGVASPGCGCLSTAGNDVGACSLSAGVTESTCYLPPDGDLCVAVSASYVLFTEPYALGVLFAANGAAARVRYADYGDWTGDELPVPAGCPTPAGIELCGPSCPLCPSDQVCSGRSPLHPYGMCFPMAPVGCGAGCPAGTACFAFTVQADAQAEATGQAVCIPSGQCGAAVTQLPGGATCAQ